MARDYCFTAWEIPKFDEDNVKYICWGVEKCPTTDKVHYQGFAVFKRTCRIPKAKQWIGSDKAHLEPKMGTRDQAREYCMKDGDFHEWGRFDSVTKEELFKMPIGYLKKNNPEFYCRYYKGLERLQDKGPKWRDIEVTWLYGGAGTGKTRRVMEMDDVYKIDRPFQWWDGYEGESILLIDDYEDGDMSRGTLLNILDGYILRLPTKGGHTHAKWTKVFVTSNHCPRTMKQWDDALRRRIRHVTLCHS